MTLLVIFEVIGVLLVITTGIVLAIFEILGVLVIGVVIGVCLWYLLLRGRIPEAEEIASVITDEDLEEIQENASQVKHNADRIERRVTRIREMAASKEASVDR